MNGAWLYLRHSQQNLPGIPQIFQAIVCATVRGKDVDDQVAEIDQHPATFRVTFNTPGKGFRFFFGVGGDSVGQRLQLTRVIAAAKEKIICKDALASDIQQ